jgi:hypothetical protein
MTLAARFIILFREQRSQDKRHRWRDFKNSSRGYGVTPPNARSLTLDSPWLRHKLSAISRWLIALDADVRKNDAKVTPSPARVVADRSGRNRRYAGHFSAVLITKIASVVCS